MNELQAEKAEIASGILTPNASRNWRSLVGNQTRSGGGRGGYCHLDKLLVLKKMRASDAGASGTDIQRLGELNELNAQGVGSAQEYRDLNADARVLALLSEGHRLLGL